jgi:hypothetical protein
VSILKWIVEPAFALMSVAKPWMAELPAPLTSQTLCGVPARQFSATTGFAGLPQSAAATDGIPNTAMSPATTATGTTRPDNLKPFA